MNGESKLLELPRVTLTRGGMHRVLAGHPWIFRNELGDDALSGEPGELVEVVDARGRFIAIGYRNPRSQIAVRVLSRVREAIDEAFWRRRLRAAIAFRDSLRSGWQCLRLVNAESDLLPGLIVDRYGDRLVMQITTAGIERQRDAVIEALRNELPGLSLRERSDMPVRELEGLEQRAVVIDGASDGRIERVIGRARFAFDLSDPHKTGFYLDQQDNYQRVAARVRPGARVLDAFCHVGGFAMHAALAGASRVIAIDAAENSIAGVHAAAALNGVADRIETRLGDAFAIISAAQGAGERYDLIVLDPPTFARDRAAVAGALRGYKELHRRALRMLAPNGVLATFSCSHHVSAAAFLDVITAAAGDAGVQLRLDARLGASPDHPVLTAVPESEYLKGFVLTALPA